MASVSPKEIAPESETRVQHEQVTDAHWPAHAGAGASSEDKRGRSPAVAAAGSKGSGLTVSGPIEGMFQAAAGITETQATVKKGMAE